MEAFFAGAIFSPKMHCAAIAAASSVSIHFSHPDSTPRNIASELNSTPVFADNSVLSRIMGSRPMRYPYLFNCFQANGSDGAQRKTMESPKHCPMVLMACILFVCAALFQAVKPKINPKAVAFFIRFSLLFFLSL